MKREGDEIDRLDGMINCASVRALLTELIVSFDEELINIVLLTSSYIIQPYRFLQTLIVFYRGGKLTYPKKKIKNNVIKILQTWIEIHLTFLEMEPGWTKLKDSFIEYISKEKN